MHIFVILLNKEREIRFSCLPVNELAFVIKEFGSGMGGGGIDLAHNRDRWRAGSCECGDDLSSSIKCGEFLD